MNYLKTKYYPVNKECGYIIKQPIEKAKNVKCFYNYVGFIPVSGDFLNKSILSNYIVVNHTHEFHYSLICENLCYLVYAKNDEDAHIEAVNILKRRINYKRNDWR